MTAFANYTMGMATFGYQMSNIDYGGTGTSAEIATAWGLALNVNDDLSVSYGEREVEYMKPSATHVTEDGEGIAIAYTMGSMKIAGNRNETSNNGGTGGSNAGSAGSGGGGAGAASGGTNGTANTGGGGGGSDRPNNGGSGGSGIVIIRYAV